MILNKKIQSIETMDVKQILDKEGICIIENFVENNRISNLREEFNNMFDNPSEGIRVHVKKDSLTSKAIDLKRFKFIKNSIFEEISKSLHFEIFVLSPYNYVLSL